MVGRGLSSLHGLGVLERTEVTHLKSQSSLEPVPRSFILSVIFSDEVSALLELLFVNTFAAMT